MAVNGEAERDSIAVNLLLNAAKGDVSLMVWVPAAATSCPTPVSAAVGQNVPQSEPNSQVGPMDGYRGSWSDKTKYMDLHLFCAHPSHTMKTGVMHSNLSIKRKKTY